MHVHVIVRHFVSNDIIFLTMPMDMLCNLIYLNRIFFGKINSFSLSSHKKLIMTIVGASVNFNCSNSKHFN